jgi:membrane dipeptidase
MTTRLVPAALAALLLAACATRAPRDERPLTLDTHVDIPFAYMVEPRFDVGGDTPLKVDLGKMERGGLDAAFLVVFVEQGPLDADGYARAVAQAERKYAAIDRLLRRYPRRIRLARTPHEIVANRAHGVLSAAIGIENAYSLGHDLARIDAAWARGARYLGLVHVGNNDLCTSSLPDAERHETNERGISDFGRDAVARANTLGMMVDVSHASDACVRDVLALSTAPVIASHSSARALVDHARNLPDELLRAIAARGGVVQAVAYREFVKQDPRREAAEKALQKMVATQAGDAEFDSEKHEFLPAYVEGMRRIDAEFPLATLEMFLDHVQHIATVAGIDHVGIASDFDGGGGVDGWLDASQTRNVTEGLRRRGYDDDDIRRIWSGNLLRVWQAAIDAAAKH